jgi:hypothetical protein
MNPRLIVRQGPQVIPSQYLREENNTITVIIAEHDAATTYYFK